MKKISIWAKHHLWTARILLIVCHLLLNCIGIITGLLLYDLGFYLPAAALPLFIIMFLSGMFVYPPKTGKSHNRHTFYKLRKSCDFVLAGSTFLVLIFIGNHFDNPLINYPAANAATVAPFSKPGDSTIKSYKTLRAFNESMKDENGKLLKWKERKKLLKEQIKGIRKAGDISKGEKVMLSILAVLVALALMYVVVALACGLACNGADGAAWLVLIGGTAVVVLLFILVMRAIYRDKKTRRKLEGLPPEN